MKGLNTIDKRKEQLAQEFVGNVHSLLEYTSAHLICGKDLPVEDRLFILAFSILAAIDGEGECDFALRLEAHTSKRRSVDISGDLHGLFCRMADTGTNQEEDANVTKRLKVEIHHMPDVERQEAFESRHVRVRQAIVDRGGTVTMDILQGCTDRKSVTSRYVLEFAFDNIKRAEQARLLEDFASDILPGVAVFIPVGGEFSSRREDNAVTGPQDAENRI